jgi:hypothetical protein
MSEQKSFCPSCKDNNVYVRVEWRQVGTKPDGSPKKRPFEVDKNDWHNCPYWKPSTTKSSFKKTDTLGKLAELETNFEAFKMDVNKSMGDLEKKVKDLGVAVAKISNVTAKQLMEEQEKK